MLEKLTKETYENSLKSGVCLVAIGASWCPDCRKIEPILGLLTESYRGLVKFFSVQFDEEESLRESLEIKRIPTLIFYKDGKEVGNRLVEPNSKPLIENAIKAALEA